MDEKQQETAEAQESNHKTTDQQTAGEDDDSPTQQNAEHIVTIHVAWSVGAGLVPIPLLDVVAVAAIQMDMLKQMCRIYNINYSESSGKAMLSTVTGSSLARAGASLVKAIPGLGTLLGGVSMPVLSGASTYAIGYAVIRHLESGGNFLDFDFGKIKEWYEEHLKKGKDVAIQIYKKQKTSSKASEAVKELEELVKMRDKGIITEEEFQLKKKEFVGFVVVRCQDDAAPPQYYNFSLGT